MTSTVMDDDWQFDDDGRGRIRSARRLVWLLAALFLVAFCWAWFARLDEASEEEEDMLDLAAGVARTSRLSCQIDLAPDLDGLKVRLPAESYDMSR